MQLAKIENWSEKEKKHLHEKLLVFPGFHLINLLIIFHRYLFFTSRETNVCFSNAKG